MATKKTVSELVQHRLFCSIFNCFYAFFCIFQNIPAPEAEHGPAKRLQLCVCFPVTFHIAFNLRHPVFRIGAGKRLFLPAGIPILAMKVFTVDKYADFLLSQDDIRTAGQFLPVFPVPEPSLPESFP